MIAEKMTHLDVPSIQVFTLEDTEYKDSIDNGDP